jgi:hypothetical protein
MAHEATVPGRRAAPCTVLVHPSGTACSTLLPIWRSHPFALDPFATLLLNFGINIRFCPLPSPCFSAFESFKSLFIHESNHFFSPCGTFIGCAVLPILELRYTRSATGPSIRWKKINRPPAAQPPSPQAPVAARPGSAHGPSVPNGTPRSPRPLGSDRTATATFAAGVHHRGD